MSENLSIDCLIDHPNFGMADFMAGGLGGAAGLIACHPLDTIRVRLQTQAGREGIFSITRRIYATDGMAAFYRGLLSPISTVAYQNAILFFSYEFSKRFITEKEKEYGKEIGEAQKVFLSGCAGGFSCLFVTVPTELVKIQSQLLSPSSSSSSPFSGSVTCAKYIYKKEGIKGLFRGTTITALRDIPSYGVYFYAYETMKNLFPNPQSPFSQFIAGGLAGVVAWTSCYPFDIIKSTIQSNSNPNLTKIVPTFFYMWRKEGAGYFLRGLNATILRAIPCNAVCFVVYEYFNSLFKRSLITPP